MRQKNLPQSSLVGQHNAIARERATCRIAGERHRLQTRRNELAQTSHRIRSLAIGALRTAHWVGRPAHDVAPLRCVALTKRGRTDTRPAEIPSELNTAFQISQRSG